MVRINLLRTATRKKTKTNANKAVLIGTVVILCIAAVIGGAGYWYLNNQKKPVQTAVVVPQPKPDFKPSSHVRPNMLEEVVKEVNEERVNNPRKGFINLAYDEMSFAEKINYEVAYGKKIFETLSSSIPSGIGMKTLEIDNFMTVYSIGIGSSSELVTQTFAKLKDNLGLLPQPYSYIKDNGNKGFKFVITCKPQFGLDLSEPFQPIDHLFSKEDLPKKIQYLRELAAEKKIQFKEGPVSIATEKIGDYSRIEFKWQCNGSYKDFVQLVNQLYSSQFPCAFKSIHIKAKTGALIDISTNLIFTVRE